MPQSDFPGFSPTLVKFLAQLQRNNTRDWFNERKDRYEDEVRSPALDFISAMAKPLSKIAPNFIAMPKKMGGSLMRPYRDTRFSKDKTPYKTNVGIQFRHELGKDVHAPGYYFHIDPETVFLGVGLWHPEPSALGAIRDSIVDNPSAWKRARDNKAFRGHFNLEGQSLKRPPKGYAADHPLIEDLKRKDFIAAKNFAHEVLYSEDVVGEIAAAFKSATPFMRFLCSATGAPF